MEKIDGVYYFSRFVTEERVMLDDLIKTLKEKGVLKEVDVSNIKQNALLRNKDVTI